MKLKKTILLLFISSSLFAYNQHEITQMINHTNLPTHFSNNKNDQLLNWQALPFPKVNEKFHIVVMKNKESLMFLYNPFSSINIYKSTDAGHHWQAITIPKIENIHHLISIDENSLLLAGDNKIYLSNDQGASWKLSAMIDESCDQLFSPTPNLILLTTNFNDAIPGLYRSIDKGKTFTPARLGVNEDFPFFTVGGKENILLAGTNRIFISTNDGLLWKPFSIHSNDQLLSSVAINQKNDIFLAASNHLYKTEITGQNWEILDHEIGNIKTVHIDENDRLYIIGQKSHDDLYRSLNNGKTWELLHHFKQIIDLHLLSNGKILVNTNEGLLLSDESELNYTKLAEFPYSTATSAHVIALNSEHFFATALAYAGPLYASNDAGKTWTMKRNTGILDVVALDNKIVILEYNGNIQQVMVSNDFGNTWQPIYKINNDYCHSLTSQHNALFINCINDSYLTEDLFHWTPLKVKKKNPIVTNYFSGKTIYITDGNSIQSTTDQGLHWRYLLDNLHQHHAYISGYKDELLIMAINNAGIIKMTNNGENWDLINNGLTHFNFTNLIVIDANHYLTSTDHGIFYTKNGGKQWIAENDGLNNLDILSLSHYQNTLLAGTNGSGVYKTKLNV